MKKLVLLLCLLSILSCHVDQQFYRKTKKINIKLEGQTAPPDMVFIEGSQGMASFYMSVTEEPNINYVIYLKWLQHVYGESYPEVIAAALPADYGMGEKMSRLVDPAYAYHPVTGLTWEQIQNYLTWKTDILNQIILVRNGFHNMNLQQKDEDNFNTEAYLVGQYEGSVRKNVYDKEEGERSITHQDNILFTGFRLPTETEWEYANQTKFESDEIVFQGKKHPYGADYYLLVIGRAYDDIYQEEYFPTYSHLFMGYNLDEILSNKTYLEQPVSIAADYGLINMENQIKEWLIDKYEANYIAEPDWKKVYRKAGFKVGTTVGLRDSNGDYVEKDSLGRMQFYRFIDKDEQGNPYEVGYENQNIPNLFRVVKSANDRKKQNQNSSASDVGFRCVLPYNDLRTLSKVKW